MVSPIVHIRESGRRLPAGTCSPELWHSARSFPETVGFALAIADSFEHKNNFLKRFY